MSTHITIGGQTIDRALLSPYGFTGELKVPNNVSYPVVSSFRKILAGITLVPTVDLSSHQEVLTVLQLAKSVGIPDEELCSKSFKGWADHVKWIDLRLPEYMYNVWLVMEELVHFRKYFRLARDPFEMVVRAIELGKTTMSSEDYIGMLKYFSEFKLELCFDMNNDKVQTMITRLRADHEKIRDHFLLDPHAHTDFFQYCGRAAPSQQKEQNYWPCDAISVVERPAYGQSTIVDLETAKARLTEFTHGLLETSPNKNLPAGTKFPWENVVVAGGGATKILSADFNKKNARQSDVDLFPFGRTFEERDTVLNQLLNWFNTFGEERSRTYYGIRGSVITIYIKDINRKFQIVSSNAKSVYDIIGRFDLTHIQWAFWNGRFYGTPQAAYSMREKLTRFSNTRSVKAYRLIKAMTNGYDVECSQLIKDTIIDITSLVEDPKNEQLQSILREFHGYYYPTSMEDYEPEEELKHILAMICKDANASMVTNDPQYVKQNVIVSGDFNNAYESISFTTFNPALIYNKGQNRRVTRTLLRTKHGVMRLTSEFLTVKRTAADDNGIKITLVAADDKFPEFTRLLEGNVYRMFRNGGVTKKLFNESHEVTLTLPRYALDAQVTRGFSCIRNQRGTPLNIEEDLTAGDKVQFMFIVEIIMEDEKREVNLKPIKFIKYENTEEPRTEDNDDIEKEVTAAEEITDIKYEEY